MQINRKLGNPEMDRIDHALGRPLDPISPLRGYQNYYAPALTEIREMDKSPYWVFAQKVRDVSVYYVTDAGKQALADYLDTWRKAAVDS